MLLFCQLHFVFQFLTFLNKFCNRLHMSRFYLFFQLFMVSGMGNKTLFYTSFTYFLAFGKILPLQLYTNYHTNSIYFIFFVHVLANFIPNAWCVDFSSSFLGITFRSPSFLLICFFCQFMV